MIGTRLGSWIIDKELGRGGMGCVYLAHRAPNSGDRGQESGVRDPLAAPSPRTPDPSAEQSAIKVLVAELAADSGFQARFQREIDILRQLDHPNIVRFRESGRQDSHSYFVMEYVPGPSYDTLLSERGRLPWPEVLELAWQIAPALKHAHDRGVIHRDLKPSNLLLAPKSGNREQGTGNREQRTDASGPFSLFPVPFGLVKLTDFGIASLFSSPHLTVTGGVVGTAEYLSPEQAAGKPVTRRSDLYSLGVVLYTLLTGRTPFVGEPLDLLHKHRFAQFERPTRLVSDVPHELEDIICALLEKEPDKRPADAQVLFRRLDSLKRKMAYQATQAGAKTAEYLTGEAATRISENRDKAEGPATLMGRLMRQMLEQEKTGGAVQQFLHRPSVLVALLVMAVGLIAWAFWPLNAETMYQRGADLMKSKDPDDWERAWDSYLGPLLAKHPDTPHRPEVEQFRPKCEIPRLIREARRRARLAGPMTEAQWFYQEGLRLRQQGDEDAARRVWKALVGAFQEVPSEGPWLELAEQELAKADEKAVERQWGPVRQAVQRARALRQEGKTKEAEAILSALEKLYHRDERAKAILKGD